MVVSYVTVDSSVGRIETEACMEGIDGWVRLANDSSAVRVATRISTDHEEICPESFSSRKHKFQHNFQPIFAIKLVRVKKLLFLTKHYGQFFSRYIMEE